MAAVAMPLANKIVRDTTPKDTFRESGMEFGEGFRQSAPDGLNAVREVWDVVWAPLTFDERQTLRTALRSVGTWGTLSWTPPNELIVRYFRIPKGQDITYAQISQNLFKVSVTVEEVFDVV